MRYRKWFLLGMFLVGVLAPEISSVHAQTITSFDGFPTSINPAGDITGSYFDSTGGHGFIRDRQGTITTFDAPGSTGTSPTSINPAGEITGIYGDSGGGHGFIRDARGTITSFDPPGSTGTFPASINPAGDITGSYFDSTGTVHGFVRSR